MSSSTAESTKNVDALVIDPKYPALFLQSFDTTKSMIENRGFDSAPLVEMKKNMERFIDQSYERELVHIECPSSTKESGVFHLVYMTASKTVRTQKVKGAIDSLVSETAKEKIGSFDVDNDEALFVVFHDWTNDSFENVMRNAFTQYNGARVHVTQIQLLLFPIMEHDLVPEHRKLSDAEFDYVKSEYHITEKTQLPSIHFTDPVARVIGLYPNDVCEITRPSKTAGTYKYYRLCVL